MSEVFREIEEDLRLERYRVFAVRYWRHAAAAAVLVVGGIGGHAIWTGLRAAQQSSEADRYAEAVDALLNNREGEAIDELAQLARNGEWGYAVLARLTQAGATARQGDLDGGRKLYDRLAQDRAVPPHYRDLARILAAMLLLDQGAADGIRERIDGLVEGDGPWRHLAREIDAHLAYRDSDLDLARTRFRGLAEDPEAPAGVRARAREMLALWESPEP